MHTRNPTLQFGNCNTCNGLHAFAGVLVLRFAIMGTCNMPNLVGKTPCTMGSWPL